MSLDRDRLLELFDGDRVGATTRALPMMGGAGGGDLELAARAAGARSYFAGGSAPALEGDEMIMAAGPQGFLLRGGNRKTKRSKTKRSKTKRSKTKRSKTKRS